jgi:hypothetical protein
MSTLLTAGLQKAQQIATTAQVLAVIALVILGIHIAVRLGLPLANVIFNDGTVPRTDVRGFGIILVSLLPTALFYLAVDELRQVLNLYRGGDFFSAAAASRVAHAGDYAVAAVIAIMLVVPNLTLWIASRGGFDTRIEPEFIGMLAFALFVSAVGRVLAAATQLKAENDAFV